MKEAVPTELDRSGEAPLYVQIAEELEGAVLRGDYRPGDRLPTEQALAKQYGVNRHTASQALNHLQGKGLIHRVRGRGSFARPGRIDYQLMERPSFTASVSQAGLSPRREVLNIRRIRAYGYIQAQMRVPAGEPLVAYERISYAGEVPLVFGTSHLRHEVFPGIHDLLLRDGGSTSLRILIQSHYGLDMRYARRIIELEPAELEASRYLGVPAGTPLLKVEGLNVLEDGTPAEWGVSYSRGDAMRVIVDGHEIKEKVAHY